MSHATFAAPDLTTFTRLDDLALVVVGQRVLPDRCEVACRVVDDDRWCRECGCEGIPRDTVVRAQGFSDCRVRHHGDIARIELPATELARLADEDLRHRMLTGVREAGFTHVTVDLAGIQSGLFSLSLLREGLHA